MAGGEAQTVLDRRNHIGFSETSSTSVIITDASPVGLSSKTVVVIRATSSTPEMSPNPGDDRKREPTPVPANTPLSPSISSTASLVGTEADSSATTRSAPATIPSSMWATETVTTVLIIPPSPTTTSTPDFQAPTTIPTIASHPGTDTTNTALATKLGLGLGIPLLVLAVAGITACIHRRQRNLQKQRLYKQAPPSDLNAPGLPPVGAADFAAAPRGEAVQHYRYGPPRSIFWSEWGPAGGVGGGGGGVGPYDDNQVGYVGSLGFEGYHQGYQLPWGGHGGETAGSPYQYQYQGQPQEGHQGRGEMPGDSSPYDSQDHVYDVSTVQIPTVRIQQPDQAPQEQQDLSVQVSGLNGGLDEVSPLSSSGSGPPYPRVSAMSGLGGPQDTR